MVNRRVGIALATLMMFSGCAAEPEDDERLYTWSGGLRGPDRGPTGSPRHKPRAVEATLERDAFQVEQIDFVDDGGVSAWGALSVDPTAVARATGAERGFVSVRTDLGWVVHNLPIQSRPENDWPERVLRQGVRAPAFVPPTRTFFNIGSERALRAIDMVVIFTSEPIGSAQDLRKWERAKLTPVLVTPTQQTQPSGITAPPPDGLPPGPPPAPPVLAPEPIEPELGVQGWYTVSLPSEDNVQSARNQCAPAAYANALAYLRSTFGLDVPHPHTRGLTGPSLVGILDLQSSRNATDPCNGDPLQYCHSIWGGMMGGLYKYLAMTGLNEAVTLAHQGIFQDLPGACEPITQASPVSTAAGSAVTVPWIRSRLENGDAVLLSFNRLAQTQNGTVVTSGHMVRVYGYTHVNGQDFLMSLDDQQQDGMVGNACMLQDGGLTWETWAVGDSDGNGTLNKGLNDLREITFAMAIAAK